MTASRKPMRSPPRTFIITDICNEPDDAQSLCRYLVYSNQFSTRGLVACNSTWMRSDPRPDAIVKILEAYASVADNLNAHVPEDEPSYPSSEYLKSLVSSGPTVYGRKALAPDVPLSEGAKLLIDRVDESPEPLWVLCWGGPNTLAQALTHIHDVEKRSEAECQAFRKKLRVYAISDQDDTGAHMRIRYPDIFYIVSVHGWNQYGLAAWTGISGDRFYEFDKGGPDFTKIEHSWIKEHIQIGPLGAEYPDYLFIPEGDTPTLLYLIQNGLGDPEHPEWGSWGGRYLPSSEEGKHYGDAADKVTGLSGHTYLSAQATIWRWRDAFQDDFAARMQWTLSSEYEKANHAPRVSVNGHGFSPEAIRIDANAGTVIELDASGSYDPDKGDKLTFTWSQYQEPSATQWQARLEVAALVVTNVDEQIPGRKVKVTIPSPGRCAVELGTNKPKAVGQELHLILEVKDDGIPSLRTYKRVIIQCLNPELSTALAEGEEDPGAAVGKAIAELRA